MPLQATTGAASYDAFGGGPPAAKINYIEDFFQSYLRTGTGASATITTGLDGSTKETLVWTKSRSAATNHKLTDNVRGVTKALSSNTTDAEATDSQGLTAFSATGYTIGTNTDYNNSGATYVDWQWVAQPKFFDVVTYTGDGISGRTVAHNLGSVPGCIIVKRTDNVATWQVYHVATGNGYSTPLNESGRAAASNIWTFTSPTSTEFTLNSQALINGSGGTYVAYLFAHNAGGFGLTGTDNVISCGSFTNNGSGNATVSLGYEPQWVLIKDITNPEDWYINDIMRGMPTPAANKYLIPNTSAAEATGGAIAPTSTGFAITGLAASDTYIYIAIRRGPMKVPTTGTSVFAPVTGNFSSPYTVTTNFPVDLTISSSVTGSTRAVNDRLRGGTTTSYNYLNTTTTAAESTGTGAGLGFQSNTAVIDTNWQTGSNALWWNFQRAPSFFDEVCYTGNNVSGRTITHNLAAVPQLMIVKSRTSATRDWIVYDATNGATKYMNLNNNSASGAGSVWVSTAPTSTVFTVSDSSSVNDPAQNYVAYLFATCAGVSKVGSYTGTGATQTVACGFGAGGARFVLIKRTDSTGDWWVWDSARGMVSGTDPRIDLNAGNSQTNANWVYTISTGFQIVTTDASVNANGGTYIFLAIA